MEKKAEAARNAQMAKQAQSLIKFIESDTVPGVEAILNQFAEKYPGMLSYCETPKDLCPVELAFQNRNVRIFQLLLEAGADLESLPLRVSIITLCALMLLI